MGRTIPARLRFPAADFSNVSNQPIAMPQKAYCRDFERLTNSLADVGGAIRHLPEPGDGGNIDAPPSVPFGSHETTGPVPGIVSQGLLENYGRDGIHFVIRNIPTGEDGGFIGEVYTLALSGGGNKQAGDNIDDTELGQRWASALAEIQRLRDGVIALSAWAATAQTESVDNTGTRNAIAALLLLLRDLESAFAETMKKWREH